MYYENGDVYRGQWANDKWNGHGILKSSDGKEVEGDFIDNVMHNAELTYSVEKWIEHLHILSKVPYDKLFF